MKACGFSLFCFCLVAAVVGKYAVLDGMPKALRDLAYQEIHKKMIFIPFMQMAVYLFGCRDNSFEII